MVEFEMLPTICVLNIAETSKSIYSIHMETIIMSRDKRMSQLDSIIQDIQNKNFDHVIIGGDFNTLRKKDLEIMIDKFKKAGINHDSNNIGYTGNYLMGLIKPENDHFSLEE